MKDKWTAGRVAESARFASNRVLISFAALFAVVWQAFAAAVTPTSLTTEYRVDPVGIDSARPRLGWHVAAAPGATGVVQTAWRVQAASSVELLTANRPDVFDGPRVAGRANVGVEWPGPALTTHQRVWWRVKTWSVRRGEDAASTSGMSCEPTEQESDWSAPARFVMGVMRPEDFTAQWIGPDPATQPEIDLGPAVWISGATNRYVRSFDLAAAPTKPCELAFRSTWYHTIFLNGEPVSFPRVITKWNRVKRMDVARFLKKGKNEMEFRLLLPQKEFPPAFILSLALPNGRRLVSDAAWRGADGSAVTTHGALREPWYGRDSISRDEILSSAFARDFTTKGRVVRATLDVTAPGFYEAFLNGRRVGDKVLDPSPTQYERRVLYSTYEVEQLLRGGANTLEVRLGHGWYDLRAEADWGYDNAPWRDAPCLWAQLVLEYADGRRETVATDASWRHVKNPVAYDCMRECGEVFGADDPRGAALDLAKLKPVVVKGPKGRLVAESQPGAKVVRTLAPKEIVEVAPGTWRLTFPENLAGRLRMKLHGLRRGDVVTLTFEEKLSADGKRPLRTNFTPGLDVEKVEYGCDYFLRTPLSYRLPGGPAFQRDRYVASGAGEEEYAGVFTYKGFEHVFVTGLKTPPAAADVTAEIISTDFPDTGTFRCSDGRFNTLVEFARRSYRANFTDGIPTDCPTREKNGWTGDASVSSEFAQYLFDNTAGYEKWVRDIFDAQNAAGMIPSYLPAAVPDLGWGNGPGWDDALATVPEHLLRYKGDKRLFVEAYPALARLVDHNVGKRMKDGLVEWGLGDWVAPEGYVQPPLEYLASVFLMHQANVCAAMADAAGAGTGAKYRAVAARVRMALRKKYAKGRGVYAGGSQTEQALAIEYGLVEPAERAAAGERLVDAVHAAKDHLWCGLYGMKTVFRALSRVGRTDLAFKMLTQPDSPSPMTWIDRSATSLWESWDGRSSHNHVFLGDFAAWAYQYLAGIRFVAADEYELAPEPIAALDFAEASVETPCGRLAASWRRTNEGKIEYRFEVPPNAAATVRIKGQPPRRVGSGVYVVRID